MVLLVFGGAMFTLGRRGQKKLQQETAKPVDKGAVRRGH